jgi:hypothetical protein
MRHSGILRRGLHRLSHSGRQLFGVREPEGILGELHELLFQSLAGPETVDGGNKTFGDIELYIQLEVRGLLVLASLLPGAMNSELCLRQDFRTTVVLHGSSNQDDEVASVLQVRNRGRDDSSFPEVLILWSFTAIWRRPWLGFKGNAHRIPFLGCTTQSVGIFETLPRPRLDNGERERASKQLTKSSSRVVMA